MGSAPLQSLPQLSVPPAGRSGARRWRPGWRAARRLTQVAFLLLFLVLFRQTDVPGTADLTQPVNLFFRLDPLAGLCAMLGGRVWLLAFWPALAVLVLTLVAGRFFCGWVCPLGTLLDYTHRLLRPLARRTTLWAAPATGPLVPVRYVLLLIVVLAALLGVPLVGYLDPFSILTRSVTAVFDPALSALGRALGNYSDDAAPGVARFTEPLYGFLRDHILAFRQTTSTLLGVTLGIFAAVLALELLARRFWCRFICPLGAGLGLLGRFSLIRRLPVQNCKRCPAQEDCAAACRMGAFNGQGKLVVEACNACMDCLADCPGTVARFKITGPRPAPAPVGLSRRGFITACAAGVALPVVARQAGGGAPPRFLLRPPGVEQETDFLNRCIRCGECLKVCPTNGLQPAGWSAGLTGVFSPTLVPRTGYCEHHCTLCAQVCPTGAIPPLPSAQKQKAIIGKALFDPRRCLPWAKNEECICCEEHCPVPGKAIHFDIVAVPNAAGKVVKIQRPYVLLERCVGCGICENKCPLDGPAAIAVRRAEFVPPNQQRG